MGVSEGLRTQGKRTQKRTLRVARIYAQYEKMDQANGCAVVTPSSQPAAEQAIQTRKRVHGKVNSGARGRAPSYDVNHYAGPERRIYRGTDDMPRGAPALK